MNVPRTFESDYALAVTVQESILQWSVLVNVRNKNQNNVNNNSDSEHLTTLEKKLNTNSTLGPDPNVTQLYSAVGTLSSR